MNFEREREALSTSYRKKTPNLQALTNPNPKQPHPIQPTPPKLQLSCKPTLTSNFQLNLLNNNKKPNPNNKVKLTAIGLGKRFSQATTN
jgi:hypothetical protein